MTSKDAIGSAIRMSLHMTHWLVSDFADADMFERATPDTNHAAWILGHLVISEIGQGATIGAEPILLPDGFREKHLGGIATAAKKTEWNCTDNPGDFWPKETYLNLLDQTRAETIKALDRTSEETLESPTPGPMARIAPRLLDMMVMIGLHQSFHTGQISAIRRKLGKPVLF